MSNFVKKTIGSRKGITWIIFLLAFIVQEVCMNKGLLEANKWSIASKALDIVAILLVTTIIVIKDITIWFKYGKNVQQTKKKSN